MTKKTEIGLTLFNQMFLLLQLSVIAGFEPDPGAKVTILKMLKMKKIYRKVTPAIKESFKKELK